MPRNFGDDSPFFTPGRTSNDRIRRDFRPGVMNLEERSLMTTVIPYAPFKGTRTTYAEIIKPDVYALKGTLPSISNPAYQPQDFSLSFAVTAGALSSGSKASIGFDSTTAKGAFAELSVEGPDTIASGTNQQPIITVADGVLTIDIGNFNNKPLPYEIDVTVTPPPAPPPHVLIVSFAKNAASTPLESNGDYNLTYQVSGSNLPSNSKPTLAVYWATGTTAASIIPGLNPVATGPLTQAVGTWTFPVHTFQMLNPPATATNLIAVLDNTHALPVSEESNTVVTLSTTGVPLQYKVLGDTWLSEPLSFELQSTLLGAVDPAANAPTREQRVSLWLQKYSSYIKSTAKTFDIDPIAIAGAIAWEAIQNVSIFSARAVGPGKVHVFDNFPYVSHTTSPAAFVEGNTRYAPTIPASPLADDLEWRTAILKTPKGAITYIAAIMNAYATEVEIANRTTKAGFPAIRNNPGVLAALYNGSPIHLQTAQADLAAKRAGGTISFSTDGTTMGQWVAYAANLTFLEESIGVPSP